MKLVLFTHPAFMVSQSMPRFAAMLRDSFRSRGIEVEIWTPEARVYSMIPQGRLSKWAGYFDQYVLFPLWVRRQLKQRDDQSVYVFCDQALGPWVPLVSQFPHVVHCHDFLALRSAIGDVPENPTSLTGRVYQRYIRRGLRDAKHFVSVSEHTRRDLELTDGVKPITSVVVYNGLNYAYAPMPRDVALQTLIAAGLPADGRGMLLHVGGGQWYKNTRGLVEIYRCYAAQHTNPLPLWMIGPPPSALVEAAIRRVPPQGRVLSFRGLSDKALQAAYSLAGAFIFPSFAEGFGWPIVEAQACGCPVITTDEAPMNEIGGPATRYLRRLRISDDIEAWAQDGARIVNTVLEQDDAAREASVRAGLDWVKRFEKNAAIDAYLAIYQRVFDGHESPATAPAVGAHQK